MNAHSHDHSHHHGHSHIEVTETSDTRRLGIALGLLLGLMIAEIVAGIASHSLALLSDAAHMLTDAGALALSLVVIRLVARPSGGNLTFGFKRAEILSAQANGFTLLVLSCLILYEGIVRLIHPPDTAGGVMLVVALLGVVVNLLAVQQVSKANRESLNIEGSFQHLATDLFAFILTAVAGAVILFTGWTRADGVAALVIAAIMLRASWSLLRASARVILEAAPGGMSVDEVGRALVAHPHVASVHDLHIWEIGAGFPTMSAHVLVHPGDDCHAVRRELEELLEHDFGIEHTTLQVDHEREPSLLTITPAPDA